MQFTAFLVCIVAWLFTDRTSFREVLAVEPKYVLLGGAIGAFITLTVIKSMDALGPAKAVMLIVIAQLIVAYLIEVCCPHTRSFCYFCVEYSLYAHQRS